MALLQLFFEKFSLEHFFRFNNLTMLEPEPFVLLTSFLGLFFCLLALLLYASHVGSF